MPRAFLFLLAVLLYTGNLVGQGRKILSDIQKILRSQDFIALQSKIDSTPGANWQFLRDIIGEFKEGVFDFGYLIKLEDQPGVAIDSSFRVNLITTKSKIIYYELSSRRFKNYGGQWITYSIDSFKNDSSYNVFQNSFKIFFETAMNDKELFLTDFAYGEHCGLGSDETKGRRDINNLIIKKNKEELVNWLKSTNTEKQIYAVDGLYELKEKGIKLRKNEQKLIDFIVNKKGKIAVCGGCLFSYVEISSITKNLKSIIKRRVNRNMNLKHPFD